MAYGRRFASAASDMAGSAARKVRDTVDEAFAKPLYKAISGRDLNAGRKQPGGEESGGVHKERERSGYLMERNRGFVSNERAKGLRDSLKDEGY